MIELKKLHDSFLMQQAFLAAAVAMNTLNSPSPSSTNNSSNVNAVNSSTSALSSQRSTSPSSTHSTSGTNSQGKQQQRLKLELAISSANNNSSLSSTPKSSFISPSNSSTTSSQSLNPKKRLISLDEEDELLRNNAANRKTQSSASEDEQFFNGQETTNRCLGEENKAKKMKIRDSPSISPSLSFNESDIDESEVVDENDTKCGVNVSASNNNDDPNLYACSDSDEDDDEFRFDNTNSNSGENELFIPSEKSRNQAADELASSSYQAANSSLIEARQHKQQLEVFNSSANKRKNTVDSSSMDSINLNSKESKFQKTNQSLNLKKDDNVRPFAVLHNNNSRKSSSFFIQDILGPTHLQVKSFQNRPPQSEFTTNPLASFAMPSALPNFSFGYNHSTPVTTTTLIHPATAALSHPMLFGNSNLSEKFYEHYQTQIQQQRNLASQLPFLSSLNPMDLFKLIAMNTFNYDQKHKDLEQKQQYHHQNFLLNKNLNNLMQQHHVLNQMSSNGVSQVYEEKATKTTTKQPTIAEQQKKDEILKETAAVVKRPSSSANILSSLEQLTKSQFKDYTGPCKAESSSKKSSLNNLNISSESSHCISNKKEIENVKSKPSDQKSEERGEKLVKSEKNGEIGTGKDPKTGGTIWPAWVYCTRYSDRPSAGPRNRKKSKKNPTSAISLNKSIENTTSAKNQPSNSIISNANSKTITGDNKNASYSSSSSNSSFSLASPSQSQLAKSASPFLNAINSIISCTKVAATAHAEKRAPRFVVKSSNPENQSSSPKKNFHENEYTNDSKSSVVNNENVNSNDFYDEENLAGSMINNENMANIYGDDDDDDEMVYDDDDDDSDISHSKRPRTAFTTSQLIRLKNEFEKCKYLTGEKRQYLANELNLNESQIKIWFQNKRAKIKKSNGTRNSLALQLAAQGLYNHRAASNK